jgi:hypothetical protein
MRASTIIVPHMEHDGQFDKSVARAVGWVFVIGALWYRRKYDRLPATGAQLQILGRRHAYISTKDRIASNLPRCRFWPAGVPRTADAAHVRPASVPIVCPRDRP